MNILIGRHAGIEQGHALGRHLLAIIETHVMPAAQRFLSTQG
jgi:hypothetical protein